MARELPDLDPVASASHPAAPGPGPTVPGSGPEAPSPGPGAAGRGLGAPRLIPGVPGRNQTLAGRAAGFLEAGFLIGGLGL